MAKRKSAEASPKPKRAREEPQDVSDGDSSVDQNDASVGDLQDEFDSDELDNDDLDGAQDDDEDESSSDSDNELDEADAEKTDKDREEAREKRREQKSLRKQRQLQKEHGEEIAKAKMIWEKLRTKTLSGKERQVQLDEAFNVCRGLYKDLVLRHDSSRVVQTIFKYASAEQRAEIVKELKGSYVLLAKSAYGKYLVVKMMHYGNAQMRREILDDMHGSFRKLMGHKEGAYVLEDAFREYATAAQRRQILREFYGQEFAINRVIGQDRDNLAEIIAANSEKRPYLLGNLKTVLTKAINKGSIGFEVIHAAMLEYLRNLTAEADREELVDLVAEQFAEMVHTSDGSQSAALLLAIANAKERKKMLKSLKPFAEKLCTDQYGQFVLMTVFLTVDDTKLVGKAFEQTVSEHALTFMSDKFARRPFLYLLAGRSPKYFGQISEKLAEVDKFKAATSKKDDEVRRAELEAVFAPHFFDAVIANSAELVSSTLGMQFVGELLRYDHAKRPAAIEALVEQFSGDVTAKEHPLQNPVASRILKFLIKDVPEVRQAVLPLALKAPLDWATSGPFAMVALIESVDDASELRMVSVT